MKWTIRKSVDRGHFDHGWLKSFHTFSFAEYRDPKHMGFRSLRVINEDVVAAGTGFGMHPHENMEIITYVLSGSLEHKDSMGNREVIRPGEIQRMSAGTGILHSEFNPSSTDPVHLLQIWIRPNVRDVEPSYGQKSFLKDFESKELTLVVSQAGRDNSIAIHQDADLYVGQWNSTKSAIFENRAGRGVWIQLALGSLRVGDQWLGPGDAAYTEDAGSMELSSDTYANFLMFDLGS